MTGSTLRSRLLTAAGAFIVGVGIFVTTAGLEAQQPAPGVACRITGTMTGLGGPLPGVSITARRGDVIQMATSSGPDGTFRLPLPEGAYRITMELSGFEPVERELTIAPGACDQPLDATLQLLPRTASVATRPTTTTASTTPEAPAAADAPAAAAAGGPGPAGRGGPGGRAGGAGRFEALSLTAEEALAALDLAAIERIQEQEDPGSLRPPASLLPPGFGSEALADAIAITGDEARVDRGMLNDRRNALNRGEFDPFGDGPRNFAGGFGAPDGQPSLGGFQGGRGGRGGGNDFRLGGRGGRQGRFNMTANYRFSGSALNSPPKQLRSEVRGTEQPYSNQNFSTTFGGPIRIPFLYDNTNNRTNLEVTFNGTRGGNAFERYATVPTDAMRAGDFSSLSVPVIDPLTGQPFENNRIPEDRISPQARALLQYYPAPNLSGDTRNYYFASTTASTSNQASIRLRHNFSGTQQGGRGGRASNAGQAGRGQRLLGTRTNVNMNLQVQFQQQRSDQLNVFTTLGGQRESTSVGSNVSFNIQRGRNQYQVSGNYNYSNSESRNRFSGVTDVSNLIGIQGVSQDPFAWGLPRLSFSSISGLSDVTPSLSRADRFRSQASWNRPYGRNHTVRVGGEFTYDVTTTNNESNANGAFVFTGIYSSNGNPQAGRLGLDFADFLLGMPQQASIQYGPGETTLTGRSLGLYIQDDWRWKPNLSWQLGLRYDLLWPFVEENGRLVNLDVTPDFTAAAPVEAGGVGAFSGAFPEGLIHADTNNVAPKIGLAWAAPKNFVVRSSYEVNYNSGTYSSIARQLAQQPPFATTGTNIGSLSTALLMENALTGIPPDETRNNYGIDKDYVLGTVHQGVINVQRQLGRTFQGSVTYTHTRGYNLDIIRAPNRDANGLRIEGVQPFTWQTAEGRSILNSATFQLQKRRSGGLTYSVEYTIAKSRDNSPSIGGGGGGGGNVAQNDQDIEAEWGRSNFDQRHRLSLSMDTQLPFGPNGRWLNNGGILAAIAEEWSVGLQFQADSGRPRSVTVSGAFRDVASGVNGALRADWNGAPVALDNPTIDQWFNTDAFSIPATGNFGSSPRNIITLPGSKNLNANFGRTVRLGGNRSVNIRMQVQNILNLANYTGVDTNVNSPTFGQVTGVSGQRRATLTLQFRY